MTEFHLEDSMWEGLRRVKNLASELRDLVLISNFIFNIP